MALRRRARPAGDRAQGVAGLLAAVGVVLLGAPVGLLWAAVAPRPDVVTEGGGLDYVDVETKDFIAADGILLGLCLLAGAVCALVVWRLLRRHSPGALLGLLAGSAVAAYVAGRVGELVDDRPAVIAAVRAGTRTGRFDFPLELHAPAVLLGWPAGAALVFALLALRRPAELEPPEPEATGAQPELQTTPTH